MAVPVKSDDIITEIGGCGRFQWRLNIIVHMINTIVCFSMNSITIFSATPSWICADDDSCDYSIIDGNGTETFKPCPSKACHYSNSSQTCSAYSFVGSDVRNMVTELNLVCDKAYIPATVMTIQVGGILLGNIVAGQLGDLVGRKPPFYSSIVIILVSTLVGFTSSDWVTFAIARFFVGVGAGFFLTIQYNLLAEFSPLNWRAWTIGFPTWPIQTCIFALLAYLIQDWRYLQLMICILCAPFLFTWWIIPESFRWHLANDKVKKAEHTINVIAKFNGLESVKIEKFVITTTKKVDVGETKRYTLLDLFISRRLVRILAISALNWGALGLISYGIGYGVQALSGNLYLNLFLFNIVGVPGKAFAVWLQNRVGRRTAAVVCYIMVIIGGVSAGILKTIDIPFIEDKGSYINGCALLAYLGILIAWGPIQTMAVELFPTVVRNVGFGFLSIFNRAAAMLGPQLSYLELYVPGILYYVCAGYAAICIVSCYFLPETKDLDLNDNLEHKPKKEKSKEALSSTHM